MQLVKVNKHIDNKYLEFLAPKHLFRFKKAVSKDICKSGIEIYYSVENIRKLIFYNIGYSNIPRPDNLDFLADNEILEIWNNIDLNLSTNIYFCEQILERVDFSKDVYFVNVCVNNQNLTLTTFNLEVINIDTNYLESNYHNFIKHNINSSVVEDLEPYSSEFYKTKNLEKIYLETSNYSYLESQFYQNKGYNYNQNICRIFYKELSE